MTLADYDAAFALWEATPGMELRAQDDSRISIERFLKCNPTSRFVAQQDEKIIGVIWAGHDGRRGYIYHTAVQESYRRQGIAEVLIKHVFKALSQEGIIRIALLVQQSNQEGKRFWMNRGWQERSDLAYFVRAIDTGSEADNSRICSLSDYDGMQSPCRSHARISRMDAGGIVQSGIPPSSARATLGSCSRIVSA
jgi:acetyltransferase, GNAT family